MGCPRGQSSVRFFSLCICFPWPDNQSLWLYILSLLHRWHSVIFFSKTRWFQQPSHSPQLFSCYKRLDVAQLSLTEFGQKLLIIGPENTTNDIFQCIGPLALYVKSNSRYLGVIFDPQFKFKHHVNKLVQSCFFFSNSETLQKSDHYLIERSLSFTPSLFPVLTIAMPCSLALVKLPWHVFSSCKMQQPGC